MIHYSRHVGSCCKPPNQKQWDQHVLQPPSDLIKSIFSPVEYRHFSQKRKKAMWLQPSKCTHRGLVQAYFSVCISPYIIHIHAWWHKRIFLFSSLMFICSENYHQETWIYCFPPSSWDRRFKLIVSHLQDSSMDCLRQSAHLQCKSDIHESFLKWGSKYCCDYISQKDRRFDHTHKEDHTSKRAKAAQRERGTERAVWSLLILMQ